jgi:hypothetical protein
MDADLMEVFGPWLPLLVGSGAILLVGGLVVKELASGSFLKGVGKSAVRGGALMLLAAGTIYVLILTLAAVFENMLSNLPGT